jgi:hypothetical protein
MTRRLALPALVVAVLAGCGGDDESRKGEDAFRAVERDLGRRANPSEAAPRWEPLAVIRSTGRATKTFTVDAGAIQWRARWRCTEGRFDLTLTPPPDDGNPFARSRCPRRGEAVSVNTGEQRLEVDAEGPWRLTVYQQVTTPLVEPPLPAMRNPAASVLARGAFYGIERRGRGDAHLYRLPDGRLALRFEHFRVSANSDLFVWLSEAARPRTTREVLRAPHVQIASLKSTLGSQNYVLPDSVDESSIRSIVIWCEPVRIAYAAVTLRPA